MMHLKTNFIIDILKILDNPYITIPAHESWYQHTFTIHLLYHPPYLWETLLAFLERRAIPGVEFADASSYARTLLIPQSEYHVSLKGWVSVTHDFEHNQLKVEMSASCYPELCNILIRLRHLFDLDFNPEVIKTELKEPWIDPHLRLPGGMDGFEVSVRTILGQQITVSAATTLAGRLVKHLGTPFNYGHPHLQYLFPNASIIIEAGRQNLLEGGTGIGDVLGPLGITGRRAATIEAVAKAVQSGEIALAPLPIWQSGALNNDAIMKAEHIMKQLSAIKGIGPWSMHAIAMRALGYPDAFLETDIGVINRMRDIYPEIERKDKKKRLAYAEAWRPLRSYAVINLWK